MKIKKLAKHIYFAVRHGDWNIGWGRSKDDPWFDIYIGYYDGNYAYARITWLWFGVEY